MKRVCSTVLALVAASAMLAGCARMAKTEAHKAALGKEKKFAVRVNAGDPSPYTDKEGNLWQPDKEYAPGGKYGFVGGRTVDRGTDMKIANTNDPRIYQTEHYAMTAFRAEVPNRKYTVRLHFAETNANVASQPGSRIFDVKIQGNTVLPDLDVMNAAGGDEMALVKVFSRIQVTAGILEITFEKKKQNPEINGIEILNE